MIIHTDPPRELKLSYEGMGTVKSFEAHYGVDSTYLCVV